MTISGPPNLRMRRKLGEALAVPVWPQGVKLTAFTPDSAREVHALMGRAYANGGGTVPAFEEWWQTLSQDSEYDPRLCFPVRDDGGNLMGFAHCWTSAFVKDLVVHPDLRRRGLGRALLLHIFRVFQRRGARVVELKVLPDNFGAVQLYASLGMMPVF